MYFNEDIFSFETSMIDGVDSFLSLDLGLQEDGKKNHEKNEPKDDKIITSHGLNIPMKVGYPGWMEKRNDVNFYSSSEHGRLNPHTMASMAMSRGEMGGNRNGIYVNPNCVSRDPFYLDRPRTFSSVFKLENVVYSKNSKGGDGDQGFSKIYREEGLQGLIKENVQLSEKERGDIEKDINIGKDISVCESEYDDIRDNDESEISVNKLKRKYDELDIPDGYKLPVSKSPIMEAMSYCAIMGWGIELEECKDDPRPSVIFRVTDFEKYYHYSSAICSKQNPTEDIGARIKSLKRWFSNFPKKKDRKEKTQFSLEVKPDVSKKVYNMVEKYRCQVNVKKIRRMK